MIRLPQFQARSLPEKFSAPHNATEFRAAGFVRNTARPATLCGGDIMDMKPLFAAGALALACAAQAAAPACSAQSPAHTVALIELYTSEGCDSCPPADRWLSSLFAQGFQPDQIVPLALHVDYWDYMGWKDPYAKSDFATRQQKLARMRRPVIIYTPQVLLQGRDFRGWGSPGFTRAVADINARPVRARLRLSIESL